MQATIPISQIVSVKPGVLKAAGILDHWEMCSNRNLREPGSARSRILDHWEMCSNRNPICKRGR